MTFQFLLHFLTPLLDAGILTTYSPNGDVITPGLVTIACSSSTLEQLKDDMTVQAPRYIFGAANVEDEHWQESWHRDLTPVASGTLAQNLGVEDPEADLTNEQLAKTKDLVARAHKKGIKLRIGGVVK